MFTFPGSLPGFEVDHAHKCCSWNYHPPAGAGIGIEELIGVNLSRPRGQNPQKKWDFQSKSGTFRLWIKKTQYLEEIFIQNL